MKYKVGGIITRELIDELASAQKPLPPDDDEKRAYEDLIKEELGGWWKQLRKDE